MRIELSHRANLMLHMLNGNSFEGYSIRGEKMIDLQNDTDMVEMSFPAKKEYARILRLAASGIAARMNFSVDGLEDLKIGLDEAFLLALSNPETHRFDAVFEIYPDRLEVKVAGLGGVRNKEEELSTKFGFSILDSVMDKIEWINTDASNQLKLTKTVC
jgi:anti-sigma regulatory factor (Ser/Thr protein kinase)